MPEVSVIIPCYNHAHYLGEAVKSVLAQTYPDWECIIVNDGSTDDTSEVARALVAGDARIRYVEQENRGLSGARNRGLAESRGRYIQLLDADDLIHPEKLRLQLQTLSPMTPALAYCDYYCCSAGNVTVKIPRLHNTPRVDGNRPLQDIALRWETELSIPVHCYLFDARLFKQHGICFDETLPNHEDWDCWMQIFSLKPAISFVNQELAVYRINENSMCRDLTSMRRGFLKAIRKQKRLLSSDQEMHRLLQRKLQMTEWEYLEHAPACKRAWLMTRFKVRSACAKLLPRFRRRTPVSFL